ncbi:MAG: hypothetical protein ACRD8A_10785 [Candidatus Acidiferrales bacterium]
MRLKQIVLGSAVAVLMALPIGQAAFGARPHDWKADCHQRLEHDKARIDRDAAKYGNHSRRVDRDIDQMETDRKWCRDHHADWDHSMFDIGIYIKH